MAHCNNKNCPLYLATSLHHVLFEQVIVYEESHFFTIEVKEMLDLSCELTRSFQLE